MHLLFSWLNILQIERILFKLVGTLLNEVSVVEVLPSPIQIRNSFLQVTKLEQKASYGGFFHYVCFIAAPPFVL